MATIAGLPDPSQVSAADAASRLAAAQAANSAYLSNTATVLPAYAQGGGAKYTAAEIADAANEAAKYQYFNSPINYAAYANTPLSSLPPNIASRVQDYYAAHPTANFQAITSQYEANRSASDALTAGGASGSYRHSSFVPTVATGEGGFTGRAADYATNWKSLSDTLDATNTRAGQQGTRGIDYASVSGLSNPFNPDSAAGISWDVAKTGGTIGTGLAAAALPEFVKAGATEIPKSWLSGDVGRSVVETPILDTSKWFAAPSTGATIPGQDMYFRIGDTGKTQLKENAKMVYAESGAFDILQVVPNNIPGSNFTRIYPWITAGGSDNALQGSAVTGQPLVTIEGKQSTALVYDEYGLNRLWDRMTETGRVAEDILVNPSNYSKSGRELYGGTVQLADDRTIQSEFEKGNLVMPGIYSPAIQSYANLVTVAAENAPKGTIASEANLPWFGDIGAKQFASMPVIQSVDMKGNLSPTYVSFLPVEAQVPTPFKSTSTAAPAFTLSPDISSLAPYAPSQKSAFGTATVPAVEQTKGSDWIGNILRSPVLVGVTAPLTGGSTKGSGMVGGEPVVTGELPAPFKSTSEPSAATVSAQNEYKSSGFLGLGGLLPTLPSAEQWKAYATASKSRPLDAAIEAQASFIEPVASTVGGVASRLSLGATEILYKPEPITVKIGSSQFSKSETFDLPTTRTTEISNLPVSTKVTGGNQTISDLGNWLVGSKDSIDRTNATAVGEYNTKQDLFTRMQAQNPILVTTSSGEKTVTTETGGTRTVTATGGETANKTYASEWDKFVEGSGRVIRYVTGETLAKQEAYKTTLAGDTSIEGEANRALFTIGTTVINKPAELAPAAITGYALAGLGNEIPAALAVIGEGTGYAGSAARFLLTPGGTSLAKAGALATFGGLYTYDVTDKLTATPEQTKTNIYASVPTLAAMYGGAGGLNWLGETRVVRGGSSPGGATFSGIQIRDAYFGGGKTPAGQTYAGAFSPTESYAFVGKTPVQPTPAAQPRLGFVDLGWEANGGKPIGLPSEPTPMRTVQQSAGGMYARPEAVRDMTWDVPLREEYAKGYSPSTVTAESIGLPPSQTIPVRNILTEDFYSRATKSETPTMPSSSTYDEMRQYMTQPAREPAVESNPLNPPRGYAPAPERTPFTIPGVSDATLRAELANFNSGYGFTNIDNAPFTIPGVSDAALRTELSRMHPAYSGRSSGTSVQPQTVTERGYQQADIEKLYRTRGYAPFAIQDVNTKQVGEISPRDRVREYVTRKNNYDITTVGISDIGLSDTGWMRTTETTTPGITTVSPPEPVTKATTTAIPYITTTPRETATTRIVPIDETTPYKRQTDITKPTDIISPIPPLVVPPIKGTTIPGGIGSGGGGSSGSKSGFSRSYENRFLYGEGVGILDFSSGLSFGRSAPRRAAKAAPRRYVSTGTIKFRGRGR